MKLNELLNCIDALTIFIIAIILLFSHYANKKSKLEMNVSKVEYWLIKTGLIIMCLGSFYGLLSVDTLPLSQTIINTGLAVFFLWLFIRLKRKYFKSEKDEDKKDFQRVDPKIRKYPTSR